MKTRIRLLITATSLAVILPVARAADDSPAAKEEKKPLRVLAGPERRMMGQREGEKIEKESVAFLGVEASPVSLAMSSQLGLARGTGLVVNHVVPKSAAAGVLNEHDILLKLDDQILIERRQLSVLIRNHKEGDEVTLTYLRAGQKATAKIKLGKTDVPKNAFFERIMPASEAFSYATDGDGRFDILRSLGGGAEGREELHPLLSLLQRSHGGLNVESGISTSGPRIQIDRMGGPGVRAMSINTGNSNIVFTDDEGSLELNMKEGAKTLVAKNARGEQVFSGAVNTPEERAAMPAEVRGRLEKLEGMHDITFHTDGDFKGAELKVLRPRGIVLPLREAVRPPSRSPAFF